MPGSPAQIAAAIASLEAQRAALGDAIVDAALAPLRRELAAQSGGAVPAAQQQLKQVSVLFVDVVGSTAIGQELAPEDIHAVMDGALERFTAVVRAHRGRVLQYTGDGMLAAFGSEETHEDDVESAVRAGLDIIAQAKALAPEMIRTHGVPGFNVRAGVHTGTVLLGGGVDAEGSIRGASVNLAARMEQSAPPGRLRISHDSWRHVRGLFEVTEEAVQVKGVAQPLRSYLIERARPRAFRVRNRGIEGLATPMIGRQAELDRLCAAFASVVGDSRCKAITIVAEAGIGKSRLLAEFRQTLDLEAHWLLLGRAHPRSALHPYGMLHDMLARQFGIQDGEPPEEARRKLVQGLAPLMSAGDEAAVPLLGHLIGLDFSASAVVAELRGDEEGFKERAYAAAFKVLRELCLAHPVVMVFDDLHWADEGTLELISRLLPASADLKLLCLMTTRPGFVDEHPDWLAPPEAHERLDLKPLDAALSGALADALLQRLTDAPAALRSMVTASAEGNPFYMEELVQMLVDDGVIEVSGEAWRVVPDRLLHAHVPTTLAGVLQARIDSLSPRERTALQQAAIVGQVFAEPALAAIDAAAVEMLSGLLRKRMIVRHDSVGGEQGREYAFQHNLLHQATYDGVLKAPRLAGHTRVGAFWSERAEVVSSRDVTPASSRALAEAQYHRCKVDVPAYLAWFEPQFELYLQAYAGQALKALMEQLVLVCKQHFGDDAQTARAMTNLARALLLIGAVERVEPLLERAIAIQEPLGADHPDQARTFAVMGGYHSGRGELAQAEPYFRQALGIRTAALGPEHPLTLDTLDNLAKITLELGRLQEAERLCRRVLHSKERLFGPVSPDTAFALTALGEVLYKLGRHAEAEPLIRRGLEVQQTQLGADNPETALSMWHLSEALRGQHQLPEAERHARAALGVWESRLGANHEWTAWGLLSLAETVLARSASEEAASLAQRACDIFEKAYGSAHPVLGAALKLLGRALMELDRGHEAEPVLARAVENLAAGGAQHAEAAQSAREWLHSVAAGRH